MDTWSRSGRDHPDENTGLERPGGNDPGVGTPSSSSSITGLSPEACYEQIKGPGSD